jgi:hypothetical protein
MHALDWDTLGKTFYLLDTFSGIDKQLVSQGELDEGILEKNAKLIETGFYVVDEKAVERNFSEWRNKKIISGSIPSTLPLIDTDNIAFLHIDLNCATPEVAALKHLWNRLVPGAMVLLDDYAYAGYRAQKLAHDALATELGMVIASLPTGQGLLIKPHGRPQPIPSGKPAWRNWLDRMYAGSTARSRRAAESAERQHP